VVFEEQGRLYNKANGQKVKIGKMYYQNGFVFPKILSLSKTVRLCFQNLTV